MEREFYKFYNDEDDNLIISITEDQKRVFEWLISIGYNFNIEQLNFEKAIEI